VRKHIDTGPTAVVPGPQE